MRARRREKADDDERFAEFRVLGQGEVASASLAAMRSAGGTLRFMGYGPSRRLLIYPAILVGMSLLYLDIVPADRRDALARALMRKFDSEVR